MEINECANKKWSLCNKINEFEEGKKVIITKTADGIKMQDFEVFEKEVERLNGIIGRLEEINESHHKFNGELMAKVDKLVADKIELKKELNKIKEYNSHDEVGEFKNEFYRLEYKDNLED